MVNSKKMSKSTVAVVVLAMLLVLSLVLSATGAWFTDSDSGNASGQNLAFGSIGEITVEATNAAWTKGDNDEGRTYVMPGDTVTAASITAAYTGEGKQNVFYVVVKDGKYYTFANATTLSSEITTSKAGTMSAGQSFTITGATVKFGEIEITADNAVNIKNDAQGKTITVAGDAFEVRIIQSSNMTDANAYTALTENWDTVKTNPAA